LLGFEDTAGTGTSYGSKSKDGVPQVPLELEQEAVFAPSLAELVIACGKPLQLSCDEAGHWQASKTVFDELVADGETAEEALGRLWNDTCRR
jgi:hypothetical protein